MISSWYLIPVSLCEHVIQKSLYRHLQVWMLLKHFCSGKIRLSKEASQEVALKVGVSGRTVHRAIGGLCERNWVGFNPESGWYFIRGFEKVMEIEQLDGSSAALFNMKWIKNIKPFAASVVIGYLVNYQKRTETRGLESKRQGSNHGSRSGPYREVSISALSQVLDVSESSAYRLRKNAQKAGFISMKQNFKRTLIKPEHLDQYKKAYSELEVNRLIKRNGEVFIQLPNLVKPEIKFKSRN